MVGSALRAFVVRSAAAALVVCSLPLSETAAAASVPWAPDCEFLPLGELPGPMEVSGVAPANDVVCYAVKPIAGSHISLEVAEGRNVIFSVRDEIDAVDRHAFRASGYGYVISVGQLMRSVSDEPFRIVIRGGHGTAPAAGTPSRADAGPARQERGAVAAVQRHLAALGFDPGPVDGVYGRRTEAAIEAFLADRGLPPQSGIDDRLITALAAEAAPPGGADPATARDRLRGRMQAKATEFCRSVHGRDGSLHANAIEASAGSASGHPDLIVRYRGFRCAGIDDAPLRQGGFCGLTMDGMKCLVEVYTYRDGDYVKASERIE